MRQNPPSAKTYRIIRETISKLGLGRIETIAGAAGGVRYVPFLSGRENARCGGRPRRSVVGSRSAFCPAASLYERHRRGTRPAFANRRAVRNPVLRRRPDAVVTVETRGIPIAMMTARALNVPLAIVRRQQPSGRRHGRHDELRVRLGAAHRNHVLVAAGRSSRARAYSSSTTS